MDDEEVYTKILFATSILLLKDKGNKERADCFRKNKAISFHFYFDDETAELNFFTTETAEEFIEHNKNMRRLEKLNLDGEQK